MTATTDSIIELLKALVSRRSVANSDKPDAVVSVLIGWFRSAGIVINVLKNEADEDVGLYACHSALDGPVLCLNACIDTCSFGDPALWRTEPDVPTIQNGYMYGRGTADSKAAVAIFAHLFRSVVTGELPVRGGLMVLFDGDEHTGRFSGVKSFLKAGIKPDVMAIGYPGNKEICIGARGFLRAKIDVQGRSSHSGSRTLAVGENAISKAADLIRVIETSPLPEEHLDKDFSFGPKVTITSVSGGGDYSLVPDRATIHVDMRLTPSFQAEKAKIWLRNCVLELTKKSDDRQITINIGDSWPAYKIQRDNPFVVALKEAAQSVLKQPVDLKVCGPSNIGNLLAQAGVPALCGFGVSGGGVHEANEFVDISSIGEVYSIYARAVSSYLGGALNSLTGVQPMSASSIEEALAPYVLQ